MQFFKVSLYHVSVLDDAFPTTYRNTVDFCRAFWLFSQHFKHQADMLYDSLDASRQKQLQGELSNASSSNSLNSQSSSRLTHDRVDSSSSSSHHNSNFRWAKRKA